MPALTNNSPLRACHRHLTQTLSMKPKDSGRKIISSFSMQKGLISKVDTVAAQIKRATGLHMDRSKLFAALCELLIDAVPHLAFSAIEDVQLLRAQVAAAIATLHMKEQRTQRRPTRSMKARKP